MKFKSILIYSIDEIYDHCFYSRKISPLKNLKSQPQALKKRPIGTANLMNQMKKTKATTKVCHRHPLEDAKAKLNNMKKR